MKLILHVGMAKTGTSTLQAALSGHAKLLQRAGVVYPTPKFRKTNHNFLAVLAQDPDRYAREFFQQGATPDLVARQASDFFTDLKRQLKRTKAETVVLSGEYFFGLNPTEAARLGELIGPLFDEVEIVAYVREPAAYYLSLMQQRVKGASELRAPARFNMRARACLPRLGEAFDATITVRPFDRDVLLGGDVVVDFLTTILAMPEADIARIDVEMQNTSMSAEAMCVMQLVRRHAFPDQEGRFSPESRFIVEYLDANRAEIPQSAPRLRPEIAAALGRSHLADLKYLDQQFGVRFMAAVPPLAPDAPEPAGWHSGELTELLEIDRDAVERVMALVLVELAAN